MGLALVKLIVADLDPKLQAIRTSIVSQNDVSPYTRTLLDKLDELFDIFRLASKNWTVIGEIQVLRDNQVKIT